MSDTVQVLIEGSALVPEHLKRAVVAEVRKNLNDPEAVIPMQLEAVIACFSMGYVNDQLSDVDITRIIRSFVLGTMVGYRIALKG